MVGRGCGSQEAGIAAISFSNGAYQFIVGSAVGPGALPFDYYLTQGHNWKPVPTAAQKSFPAIEAILTQKKVRSPLTFSKMPMNKIS